MRTQNAAGSFLRFVNIPALGAVLAAMFVTPTAFAAVTYIGQLRSVSTFATVDFVAGEDAFNSDLFESDEIDQFEGAAICHAGELGNEANSTGHQLSYLEPNGILAEGNMSAQAQIGSEATFAEGFGLSRLNTLFSVDVPTQMHLLLTTITTGNGITNFLFRVADGTIFIYRTNFEGTEDIEETFTLEPGIAYELNAQSSGFGQALQNGGGEPAFASYAFSADFTTATGSPEIVQGLANPFAPIVAPNPVRGSAHIAPASGTARLYKALDDEIVILDLAGRVVRRFENVGASGVTWDTRDSKGTLVAAGVYLVRGGTGESTRAVVLR
jgi:hypothetical protein